MKFAAFVFTALLCACATSSSSVTPESSILRQPNDGRATFTYTGAKQSFKVPAGVTQVTITARGASGATGYGFGSPAAWVAGRRPPSR
jgi:hypothetical protein